MNTGPVANPGPRCPFQELRMVTVAAGESVAQAQLPNNEHWLVCDGVLHLTLGNQTVELYKGDVALLRAGLTRQVWTDSTARVVLVRERIQP